MARPRSFDEAAAVGAAAACFRRLGYAATSVDDLVSEGLSRETLYKKHLVPWLTEHQRKVESRGARCALIDHPVPAEHYKAVAEVIGFVMRLRRRAA